ncbi:nucleotide exchange factor GrpE [Eubacteriales bacterium OttesenSCG-928-K08]|nr:nucleotide exchange factor GrpE [Eubacteriales bacterium OttesenSCG-928-K08]
MAKKTEDKTKAVKNETADTKLTNETEAGTAEAGEESIPEVVQLTREEFLKVREHIEALKKEKDENVNLAQRLQADFDNYRKRNSSLKKDSYDEGQRDCMRTLLPTLDNFERALNNAKGVDPAYVDGMRLVQKNLLETLGKLGMKEIDATGMFDPNLHNAVMQEEVEGRSPGEILEVLQTGYEVEGKILRYSMVKVAQ